jgi:hypothetical protein
MVDIQQYEIEEVIVSTDMANSLIVAGWNFDWSLGRDKSTDPDVEYIKVGAYLNNELEGLIKYTRRPDELFNFVHLIELAPYNVGAQKMHSNVAGTLFASVALDSLKQGYDGFVVFESMTVLYNHYMLKYGAKPVLGKLLMFDTNLSIELIRKYLGVEYVNQKI